MFVHHVFFWLKEDADKAYFHQEVSKLGSISEVQSIHVGTAPPAERDVVDGSFDFSLLMTFANKADQDAYQVHPDHHVFIDNCSSLWTRVQVYDAVD